MRECERKGTGLLTATDELRQLIIDNPDLPILVFAGQDCNNGDYGYMACGNVSASLGEFLDCQQDVDDERCFTDREEFGEMLGDQLYDEFDGSDREWEEYLESRIVEYDPYWKPCIIIYVDN